MVIRISRLPAEAPEGCELPLLRTRDGITCSRTIGLHKISRYGGFCAGIAHRYRYTLCLASAATDAPSAARHHKASLVTAFTA
jgi:hypothetical protein